MNPYCAVGIMAEIKFGNLNMTNVEAAQAHMHSSRRSSKFFSSPTKNSPTQDSSSTSLISKTKNPSPTSTFIRSYWRRAATSFIRTAKLEEILPIEQVQEIEGGAVIIHLGSDKSSEYCDGHDLSQVEALVRGIDSDRNLEKRAKGRNDGTDKGDRILEASDWDDLLPLSPFVNQSYLSTYNSSSPSLSALVIMPSPPNSTDLCSSTFSDHVPTDLPRRPPRAVFALSARKSRAQIKRVHPSPIYSPAHELQDNLRLTLSSKILVFTYSDSGGAMDVQSEKSRGKHSMVNETSFSRERKLVTGAPFIRQLPKVAASPNTLSLRTMDKENRGLLLRNSMSRCGGQERIGFL